MVLNTLYTIFGNFGKIVKKRWCKIKLENSVNIYKNGELSELHYHSCVTVDDESWECEACVKNKNLEHMKREANWTRGWRILKEDYTNKTECS